MPKIRPTYMTKQKAEIARENLAKFPQAREEIEKQHLQFKSAFEVASNPIPEAVNKDEVVEA